MYFPPSTYKLLTVKFVILAFVAVKSLKYPYCAEMLGSLYQLRTPESALVNLNVPKDERRMPLLEYMADINRGLYSPFSYI